MRMDLNWNSLIYNWSDAELRFALQAVTDTAPTPTNLRRWGCREVDPSCVLCGRPCTLRHLLNACSSALQQGRYTWRHNSVLAIIRQRLLAFWKADATQEAVKQTMQGRTFIKFLPAGHSGTRASHQSCRRPLSTQHILLQASYWDFRFDLGSEALQFPIEAAATSLRPDIVIYSCTKKIVVMLELTVPLEDRSHLAHERKTSKYASLARTCEENGFTTHFFALEVGCLRFCPHSFLTCLEALGLPKSLARKFRTECARVALRCSYLLYLRRGISNWNQQEPPLVWAREQHRADQSPLPPALHIATNMSFLPDQRPEIVTSSPRSSAVLPFFLSLSSPAASLHFLALALSWACKLFTTCIDCHFLGLGLVYKITDYNSNSSKLNWPEPSSKLAHAGPCCASGEMVLKQSDQKLWIFQLSWQNHQADPFRALLC